MIINRLKFSVIENLSIYWTSEKFDIKTSTSANVPFVNLKHIVHNHIYIFIILKKIYDCLIKTCKQRLCIIYGISSQCIMKRRESPPLEKCPNTEFILVRIFPTRLVKLRIQLEQGKIRTLRSSVFGLFSHIAQLTTYKTAEFTDFMLPRLHPQQSVSFYSAFRFFFFCFDFLLLQLARPGSFSFVRI